MHPYIVCGKKRVKQGESWFSLFLRPCVSTGISSRRQAPGLRNRGLIDRSRQTAIDVKKQNVLEFPVPRVIIDAQMEGWYNPVDSGKQH